MNINIFTYLSTIITLCSVDWLWSVMADERIMARHRKTQRDRAQRARRAAR